MTAVEWLTQEIINEMGFIIKNTEIGIKLFNQAKEMEKQQIIEFANDLLARNDNNYIALPDLAEQYYTETYEKNL